MKSSYGSINPEYLGDNKTEAVTNSLSAASEELLRACEQSKEREALSALALGADPMARGSEGMMAGHWGGLYGMERLLEALCDHGWDLDSQEGVGRTALMMALSAGKIDAARLLLEKGANAMAMDGAGRCAGHFAAENHLSGAAGIELLLGFGWTAGQRDAMGRSSAHEAAIFGNIACLEKLLEAGWDPAEQCQDGSLAEDLARAEGHGDCAELLRGWRVSLEERSLLEAEILQAPAEEASGETKGGGRRSRGL